MSNISYDIRYVKIIYFLVQDRLGKKLVNMYNSCNSAVDISKKC